MREEMPYYIFAAAQTNELRVHISRPHFEIRIIL